MEITYKVYALIDPKTGSPAYVGQTIRTLAERRSSHLTAARRGSKQAVAMWVRALLNEGLKPVIKILESTTQKHIGNSERRWIAQLSKKHTLQNVSQGSDRLVQLA